MDYPAGPSPAWLGALALAGFTALVAAAFASGYHLVGGGSERAGVAASSTGSRTGGSRTGIVREGLAPDRAVLREKADDTANIVARLPSGVAVSVISESGEYAQIRYERQGKVFEGWTPRANLSLR